MPCFSRFWFPGHGSPSPNGVDPAPEKKIALIVAEQGRARYAQLWTAFGN